MKNTDTHTHPKRTQNKYNWKPDLPDQRDRLFGETLSAHQEIPPSIDLRSLCPPIVDQGRIGSCTGNALAGALGFLERNELQADGGPETFGSRFAPFSRLFIYYNERALEGTQDQDSGAQIRDGIKTLAASGACRESVWKYTPENVLKAPSSLADEEAIKHRIANYLRMQTLAEMRACLASGFPFVFGFTVYESFESIEVASTGIMQVPSVDERVLGGHAVLAVGYDDEKQSLLVRNSWGEKWGISGYFYMPYEIITRLKLAQDFWTIRK